MLFSEKRGAENTKKLPVQEESMESFSGAGTQLENSNMLSMHGLDSQSPVQKHGGEGLTQGNSGRLRPLSANSSVVQLKSMEEKRQEKAKKNFPKEVDKRIGRWMKGKKGSITASINSLEEDNPSYMEKARAQKDLMNTYMPSERERDSYANLGLATAEASLRQLVANRTVNDPGQQGFLDFVLADSRDIIGKLNKYEGQKRVLEEMRGEGSVYSSIARGQQASANFSNFGWIMNDKYDANLRLIQHLTMGKPLEAEGVSQMTELYRRYREQGGR